MNTHRVTVGFVTVLVMACCLVLGGLASPAVAKTIVVTTLDDIADPPFNADGPCGTGTISDLPGTDHLVSLREAIIAANNTKGADIITFAPSLSGGTIVVNFDDFDSDGDPDPLPVLCGGQTRIDGDLNGDDVPDITLEGSALPAFAPLAGLGVISSHNTIHGLQVRHFPFGIVVQAGDFPTPRTPRTVTHTTVTNNILANSSFHGILVLTGDAPGSVLAHTTITHNRVVENGFHGILVLTNLSGAGADTQITHTTITGNEVRGNGFVGIEMLSQGDHNAFSHATIARNTVAGNTLLGIQLLGGFGGADENTFEVAIRDNTVTDNGHAGIAVNAGVDNSSNNHVVARVRGNTVARHQTEGIAAIAAVGAINFPTGTSNHNVLEVRIERNTVVENQPGDGIYIAAGEGSPDGRRGAVADDNQTRALVVYNTVEDNANKGIELDAGSNGLANSNTLAVWVAHNTVCHNTDTAILGEGGFSGDAQSPVPNLGTRNVLAGQIFENTAATVTVQDGAGAPGNQADVTQFNNDPCP